MSNVHNFGAGPAKIPAEVYETVRENLTNFEGTGISLMETSHRSSQYMKLNQDILELTRKLLNVPDNYKIIFLHGGGTGQFAAVPLNLISRTGTADYVVTGAWSKKAAKEAEKYGKINMVIPTPEKYIDIPAENTWKLNPDASYVHICANETIHGIEFHNIPDTKGVPLVADMSSNIMSKRVDVSKFGVIYAGAQKNIGTSGVVIVIIRDDLLKYALPQTPSILDWNANVKNNSILNTPPMFPIYVMGEVFRWIDRIGGLEKIESITEIKSSLVYNVIDSSNGFYSCPISKKARSKMNVPFRIGSEQGVEELEKQFLKGADPLGLLQLKGHRDAGGIRASIYNAVTVEDVNVLVKYMEEFMAKHRR